MQLDPLKAASRGSTETISPAARPAVVPVAPPQPVSDAQVQAAVAQINQVLKAQNNSLQFELDRSTGKTVVRVIDGDTQEVVRQFPSEEVLAIARAIPPISGALLRDTA